MSLSGFLDGGLSLAGIIALLFASWGVYRYFHEQRTKNQWREFEVYHNLIKELVEGEAGVTRMDRQGAIIFELRSFPRYHEFTTRTLLGLQKKWSEGDGKNRHQRLLEEIELALEAIRKFSQG